MCRKIGQYCWPWSPRPRFRQLVTIAFALDRIERRAGRAAVTHMAPVMPVVGDNACYYEKTEYQRGRFGSSFIVAAAQCPALARTVE